MAAITITSKKYLKFFFTLVPFISAGISTIHLLNLFDLGNANWLSILLSIAFEIGSISAFLMMSEFKQRHTFLKWFIFLILFFMQIIGNIYYSFEFINISLKENPLFLESFTELANVFIMLFREDPLTTSGSKFLLSCLVGLPVPIISLAFLKARMNLDIINEEEEIQKIKESTINHDSRTEEKTEEELLIESELNKEQKQQEDANFVQVITDEIKTEEPVILTTTNAINDQLPLIIDMLSREIKNKEVFPNPSSTKKKKPTQKKKKKVVKEEIKEEEEIKIIPEEEEEKKEIEETTTTTEGEIGSETEEKVLPQITVTKKEKQIVNIPEQTLEEKKQEENLLMMTTITNPTKVVGKKTISKTKKPNTKKVIVETLDLDEDFKVPHINN